MKSSRSTYKAGESLAFLQAAIFRETILPFLAVTGWTLQSLMFFPNHKMS